MALRQRCNRSKITFCARADVSYANSIDSEEKIHVVGDIRDRRGAFLGRVWPDSGQGASTAAKSNEGAAVRGRGVLSDGRAGAVGGARTERADQVHASGRGERNAGRSAGGSRLDLHH